MELRNYGDEVFQADYLQKKRNRRGKVEFLVKWKGYSTKQSTWEPADNILDPLLIAEFESKREEWRKKQRLLRKKRKQRLASAEQLSDANDSEQDDVLPFRHNKRRGHNEENLWPYLPSDRLPLLWGTPPRAPRPRKARQKPSDGRKRKLEEEENNESEIEKIEEKASEDLSVIYEKSKRRRKEDKIVEDEEEEDEEEEEEDEDDEDDDDEEEEEEDEDEEKWSTECWEVKYSPTLASSPGEPNVLRVHRVRSDVDYVERELSPLSDTASGLKNSKPANNNNNSNIINNNNNTNVVTTESKNIIHCPRNPIPSDHIVSRHEASSTAPSPSHTHTTSTIKSNCFTTPAVSSSSSSTSNEGLHNVPKSEPRNGSSNPFSTQTSLTSGSTHHATSNANGNAKEEAGDKDEEDDWNFSSHFENQVMKERERLEAQILQESNALLDGIDMTDRKVPPGSDDAKTSLWNHPRCYSYSNSDQYQHKKLHHARRRHTLDTSREGKKITVTNVKCHHVKVTFVESDSDRGFFKHSMTVRTG